MTRIIGIWISGLIASGLAGLFAGGVLSRQGEGLLWAAVGLIGGVAAFTCARLWVGDRRR